METSRNTVKLFLKNGSVAHRLIITLLDDYQPTRKLAHLIHNKQLPFPIYTKCAGSIKYDKEFTIIGDLVIDKNWNLELILSLKQYFILSALSCTCASFQIDEKKYLFEILSLNISKINIDNIRLDFYGSVIFSKGLFITSFSL